MAGIEEYLNQIKNAIYGKDVRQAIHDGIHACYEDGKAGSIDLVAREQIAELVAPSGEAPSAAEVTDARIGADGTVYASLGIANRTQNSSLKSTYFNGISLDQSNLNVVWEQGGFAAATGKEVSTNNYIRTSNFFIVDAIKTIHLENSSSINMGVSLMLYDNLTGSYKGRIKGEEITLNAGASRNIDVSSYSGSVRVSFKYTPAQALEPSAGENLSIDTISKVGDVVDSISTKADYTEGQAKVAESKGAFYPVLSWAQGSVSPSGMNFEVDYLTNYIRSNILTVSAVDKLNVSTSLTDFYYIYCRCYDEDGNQLSSTRKSITNTNVLEFDVSEATFVRLIVSRTDTTIDVSPSLGASFGCYFNNQIVNRMIDSEIMSNLMASFKRFAVIGDSLSAGHIYPDPSTTSGNFDDKSIAWGTWITRKLDNTYYNFSRAGMDAYQFVRGIREADQSDLGDNKLAVALDGDHDAPLYIINLGVNNPHGLSLGSTADIDLSNPDNNGNTVIGWYSKMVQKISSYYEAKNVPVHIVLNVYGFMPAGGDGDAEERLRADGRIVAWTKDIYEYIKSTIEGQGNHLYFLDLYSNDPEVFRNEIFMYDGAVVQKHWTSVGYNAVGMAILRGVNNLIWDNSSKFKRIEFIESNSYIESYNNPANFT